MADRRALVGNASSERQQQRAKQIEKQRADQRDADVATVLGTAAGIRLFTGLLDEWNAFGPVFNSDALVMAYQAGRRDCALALMLLVDGVPGAMAQVLAERARRDAEISKPASSDSSDQDGDE